MRELMRGGRSVRSEAEPIVGFGGCTRRAIIIASADRRDDSVGPPALNGVVPELRSLNVPGLQGYKLVQGRGQRTPCCPDTASSPRAKGGLLETRAQRRSLRKQTLTKKG